MKLIALNGLNSPIENGVKRTREAWQKWGEKRLTETEKRAGWVCVVGLFDGYYRVNFAAQPINLKMKLNGSLVR